VGGLVLGCGSDGDGDASARGGCVVRALWGGSVLTGVGADSGAPRTAEGLGDGECATVADDGRGNGLRVVLAAAVGGVAAAGWSVPRLRVSAMPSPATASTATRTATPEWKGISSMRAFSARLSLVAQPLPSVTT
jgi:hypothetical protein